MDCKLFDICFYPVDSTSPDIVQIFNYVNTKSMLPNKRGITVCSSTPSSGNIRMYKYGDVLVSNIQPNFRKIWYATHDGTCSNDILVIRSKSCCLSDFLYCILQTDEFFNYMAATTKGTTIPRSDKEAVMEYKVTLPDLKTQAKISEMILSIESKLQVNANLTVQIKTLTDREFPYDEDTCPEGWDVVKVSEVADVTSGYSYKGDELVDKSDSALVTLKNFDGNGGFKTEGYKPLDIRGNVKSGQYVDKYDVLIAHTDSQDAKIIGNAEIVLNKGRFLQLVASMHVFKVVLKDLCINNFLLTALLKQDRFKGHCLKYVNGTTVLELNKDAVRDYKLVIPHDQSVIERCNKICKSIYEQMAKNLSESTKLSELRDYILPKLMSGEIDVSKLELPD